MLKSIAAIALGLSIAFAPHRATASDDPTTAAFAALIELGASTDRTLDAVERTLGAVGTTPFARSVVRLRGELLPAARARSRQAIDRCRRSERTRDPAERTALLREATGHALAATIQAQVLQHAANVETVAAWADHAGMSFGLLRTIHADQSQRAIALLERCRETDPDRLARLAVEASEQVTRDAEQLAIVLDGVDGGAVLARKVVLVADLILLATALRSVASLPAIATRGAGPSIHGMSVGAMSAGGAAVAVRAAGVGLTGARLGEIIKTLVAAGALRPALAGVGATTLMMAGGGPAPPPAPGRGAPYVSTQTWDTSRNAEILRKRMDKAGVRIGPNEQVHHIVPSTHPEAAPARRILERLGIDANEACNGVPIPKNLHYGQRLHSKAGIQWVMQELSRATTRNQAIGILQKIAAQIQSGRVPML